MRVIDLNADIGEADNPTWAKAERGILNYVSSANIACGGHAGNDETMRQTIRNAKQHGVNIGAHPSYPDRENFGRISKTLGQDIDADSLRREIMAQITRLMEIAADENYTITYVKPHGALYNDAVGSAATAELITSAVRVLDAGLYFMGGPNSEMTKAAKKNGLRFIAEGFIDRRYTNAGHLQSRSIEGAVIKDQATRMDQARRLVTTQSVQTAEGSQIKITAQSLCLHGDSDGAVNTARLARNMIENQGVTIRAFTDAA